MGGEMRNHVSGIYCIKNLINGKVYIGQSKSCTLRWRSHRCYLKAGKHKNPYLQKEYNMFGFPNFTYTILEECSPDCKDEREKYWLEQYKGLVYNLQSGGTKKWKQAQETKDKMKDYKHSDETRQKISEGMKEKQNCLGNILSDEHRRNISNGNKGNVLSEEHCKKLREANLGKTLPIEHRKKLSESHKGQKAWNKGNRSVSEDEVRRRSRERQAKYRDKKKISKNIDIEVTKEEN